MSSKTLVARFTGLFPVFALLFCFTTVAFADDGVKVITQGSVLYAGGFPYKITQPGSYRLGSNLTVPANTDGIDITADNVTLDLNGFSITGPVTCTGTVGKPISSCSGAGAGNGVFSLNDNSKLTNGSVVGFAAGISLTGAGNLVEAVSAKFNINYGMYLLTGTVRNCSAIKNFGAGLVASDAVIEGSVFVGNRKLGVNASSSTLIGNMFSQNAVGLAAQSDVYGSNTFSANGTDIADNGGNTSQNNNNCSGGTC